LLLLVFAMCAAVQTACLISPVDPPLAAPYLNIPPAIIDESVLPRLGSDGVIRVSCEGQELATDFEVGQVAEYNTEQTLHFSWFVDYTADALSVNRVPFREIRIEPLGDEVLRDVNQKVRVPLNWLPRAAVVGPHLVEVVVADAAPLPSGLYPYRSLPPGALSDQYHWSIEVLGDGSCDQ
jgi:hypothetical protein